MAVRVEGWLRVGMAEVAAVSGPGPADAEARALRALSMAEALPTAEPKSEETNASSSTASDASQTSTPMVSDRYTKKTPGKSYLRFESEEEELEWIENNDFIRQMSPWLYFMASTLSFVWAQSFYWWKALPDEEQVCTRDSLGNWFCEKGEVVPLILRSHPLKGNLGNKSTLVSWMLMFHTALSAIFTYLATLMPRCLRRSANAGPNPSEERIGLLYIVARMLVMVALLCQWVHVWLMDTKYKGTCPLAILTISDLAFSLVADMCH